jgi:hypothetical protein
MKALKKLNMSAIVKSPVLASCTKESTGPASTSPGVSIQAANKTFFGIPASLSFQKLNLKLKKGNMKCKWIPFRILLLNHLQLSPVSIFQGALII